MMRKLTAIVLILSIPCLGLALDRAMPLEVVICSDLLPSYPIGLPQCSELGNAKYDPQILPYPVGKSGIPISTILPVYTGKDGVKSIPSIENIIGKLPTDSKIEKQTPQIPQQLSANRVDMPVMVFNNQYQVGGVDVGKTLFSAQSQAGEIKSGILSIQGQSDASAVQASIPSLQSQSDASAVQASIPSIQSQSDASVVKSVTPSLQSQSDASAVQASIPYLQSQSDASAIKSSTPSIQSQSDASVIKSSRLTWERWGDAHAIQVSSSFSSNNLVVDIASISQSFQVQSNASFTKVAQSSFPRNTSERSVLANVTEYKPQKAFSSSYSEPFIKEREKYYGIKDISPFIGFVEVEGFSVAGLIASSAIEAKDKGDEETYVLLVDLYWKVVSIGEDRKDVKWPERR